MSLNYINDYNIDIRKLLIKVFKYANHLKSMNKLIRISCPVCGSDKSEFFANNDYLDYEKCTQCSLVYMNPTINPKEINDGFKGNDQLLVEYFYIMQKYKCNIPSSRPDPLSDNKLSDIYGIRQNGRLLDVGCSVGDFLHKAKYFYEVEGVEVNPLTSAIAEKHFTIHKAYLNELNLPAVYDIVTLHQILYGVPDPVGLLGEIHKILKNDGILYVNTANADSYAVDLYGGKASHLYGYTIQNIFNRKSLEKLASLTGFKIVKFRTEWLDIYITDLLAFYNDKEKFIHKRNCWIKDYEDKIRKEDELHKKLNLDLYDKGNYLVAVLAKL